MNLNILSDVINDILVSAKISLNKNSFEAEEFGIDKYQ